jgi:hypothetical protein
VVTPAAQPFRATGVTTLDANGAGQVVLATPSGVDWMITHKELKVATNTKEPTATLYRGSPSPAGFLEGSYTGSHDTSSAHHLFRSGEILTCVWALGDAGARAELRIAGAQYPPGSTPQED